jgi:hypothetical protein
MNDGAILNVYLVPHTDEIHISPHYGIEPNAAIITHDHITNNRGIGSQKAIISKLRMFILYRKQYRHKNVLMQIIEFICFVPLL